MQAYGESLSAVLAHVIGDLASVAMISLFNPMHYLIQIFGGSAVKLLLQPLTKLLHLLLSGEVLLPLLIHSTVAPQLLVCTCT